jgi:hypothetical protein
MSGWDKCRSDKRRWHLCRWDKSRATNLSAKFLDIINFKTFYLISCQSEWKMAKCLLTLGAKPTLASLWCPVKETVILGCYVANKTKNGNATLFAEDLKSIGSETIKDESFDALIELMNEEVIYLLGLITLICVN